MKGMKDIKCIENLWVFKVLLAGIVAYALGGGGLLSLILDEDVPFCLKIWTHNSANMMKTIPIIPQSK